MNYKFLARYRKPSRYIGTEWNAGIKAWDENDLRVALVFPEPYELGMSHYGSKIVYDIINRTEGALCDRFYMPWPDRAEAIRAGEDELLSLESKKPLRDFSLIGVTLQYEMSYPNLLNLLSLAGMPWRAEERGADLPPIIGGGPCTFNPAPLSSFLDAFLIGEGEEAVSELMETARRFLPDKDSFLKALAKIPGFYVPLLHNTKQIKIKKRFIKTIENISPPKIQPVPFTAVTHDRLTIEIQRGCVRGCRFCQAGMIYRPSRQADPSKIVDKTIEAVRRTGYEEVGFLSLNANDYEPLPQVIRELRDKLSGIPVKISLPSQRIDHLPPDLAEVLKQGSSGGVTFAPEAGTERLRRVINKPASDEEICEGVRNVFKRGWRLVKLYFMTGLPTETDEDIEAISLLLRRLFSEAKKVCKRPSFNVTISPFVPKPHTPFQWERQDTPQETREKYKRIISNLKLPRKAVSIKLHDPLLSAIEGLFSRGGVEIGKFLEEAVARGAGMEGWSEFFNPRAWIEAMSACEITFDHALRERGDDEKLPWDFIDCGVTKRFLLSERKKSREEVITPFCADGPCTACGVCPKGPANVHFRHTENAEEKRDKAPSSVIGKKNTRSRILIKYSKTGPAVCLSHLETVKVFVRAVRRANLPVAYSRGFNPSPRISFDRPLPTGIESSCEYAELLLIKDMDIKEVKRALNSVLPEGIEIKGVSRLKDDSPPPDRMKREVRYMVSGDFADVKFCTKGKALGFEFQTEIKEDGHLEVSVHEPPGRAARPLDIVKKVLESDAEDIGFEHIRKADSVLSLP